MLHALLLATLATLPQDPPPAPTLAERLEKLIEKTNAYGRFVVTYRVQMDGDEPGVMRLVYRGPDHGLFEMTSDKGWMRQFIVGGTIDTRSRIATGAESTMTLHSFGELARLNDSAFAWTEEFFPRKTAPSKPRPESGIVYSIAPGADGDGLNITTGLGTGARLEWLARLLKDPEHVSGSGDSKTEVAYSRGKTRICVDLETGFVTKVDADGPEGKLVLTLVSADLEAPSDETDLAPPAPAPGAEDLSRSMEAMSWVSINEQVRGIVYQGIALRLDEDRLEWNEGARGQAGKLLQRVDEELVATSLASLRPPIEEWIETNAEKISTQIAAGGPEVFEQLRASSSKARANLEQQLGGLGQQLFAQKPQLRSCKLRPSLGEELLALEEPILREVCDESVIKPLLAVFDEKIGKQFEAK